MLFDDAGPTSQINSSFARCWLSVASDGAGGEKHTRYMIATGLKDDSLVDRSWRPMLAEFERLAQPVEDGKWGGALLFVGADLEYACNMLGMPHFNSNEICVECMANTTDIPHNNFGVDAAWRATLKTPDQYFEHFRKPLHPFVCHDFYTTFAYRYDLLHMLDHHGVASQVLGNICWHHVSHAERETNVLPGDTVADRVDFLTSDMHAWYQQHNVGERLPSMKESMIKPDGGFPDLCGNGVKAANVRAAVPYALDLQQRATAMNPTNRQRHMLKIIESLNAAYVIFYNAGTFLTDAECQRLKTHLTHLGRHYQVLQLRDLELNRPRWKTTTKMHYVCAHLGDQAELINPRRVQGYASESMVGRVCTIYKASQRGPYHDRIQEVALTKYKTGMKLLWV